MWMFIAVALAALLLLSGLLLVLWNTTVPELFSLPRLTFGQALRLLLIATILFGGPGIYRAGVPVEIAAALPDPVPAIGP